MDPFLFQAMTNRYYAQSAENVQRGVISAAFHFGRAQLKVPSIAKQD